MQYIKLCQLRKSWHAQHGYRRWKKSLCLKHFEKWINLLKSPSRLAQSLFLTRKLILCKDEMSVWLTGKGLYSFSNVLKKQKLMCRFFSRLPFPNASRGRETHKSTSVLAAILNRVMTSSIGDASMPDNISLWRSTGYYVVCNLNWKTCSKWLSIADFCKTRHRISSYWVIVREANVSITNFVDKYDTVL